MNIKNNKGAATLFVLVSGLFFIAFLVSILMITSVRRQTQAQATKQTQEIYSNGNEEEIYQSYFGDGAVPIYTFSQLQKMCSGEEVTINEVGGKIYTFSSDATYVLMNNIIAEYEGVFLLATQNFTENGRFEGNSRTIKIRDTSKPSEVYYYYSKANGYTFPITREGYSYADLKLHLDGIKNNGNGHVFDTEEWVDLSGSYDEENKKFPITDGSWDEDSLELNGDTTGVFVGNKLKDLFKSSNTIEMLVKPDEANTEDVFVGNYSQSNSINYAKEQNSSKVKLVINNNTIGNLSNDASLIEAFQVLTWVWNKESNSVSMYQNGELIQTISNNQIGSYASDWTDVWFGRNSQAGNTALKGNIGSIRIYNRILTEAEIKHNYNVDTNRQLFENFQELYYWVTYAFGNENFVGNNYINTGIPLFSENNLNKDFEISISVSNYQYIPGQSGDRNLLISNQYEVTDPYQGLALGYRDGEIKIQANSKSTGQVKKNWGKTSGDFAYRRTDGKLYADNVFVIDYADIKAPFTAPLIFGGGVDKNLNPWRYCKADLSNIKVKLKYSYDEFITLYSNLPTPTNTGYTFGGWYTEAEGGTNAADTPLTLSDKTLYPRWINPQSYTITFNANTGTGSMPKQTGFVYGQAKALNANTFTKNEKIFKEWNTRTDGKGVSYLNGAEVTNLGSITLYAQWEDWATLVTQPSGETAKFLGGEIAKNDIESVRFTTSIEGANNTKWDVSTRKDGSILAWYEPTHDGLYAVTIGSTEGFVRANPNSSNLLAHIGKNEKSADTTCIYGIENLDVTYVTNMNSMFSGCNALASLNLSNFNTANVTNMGSMFNNCQALASLNLGNNFNTANVTNMSYMFQNCNALTSLDLSSFNTANVTNMSSMFSGCTALASLDLGNNFNTENVQQMQRMFQGCNALASLNLGDKFDTSNVTNTSYCMQQMFKNCNSLVSLDLGNKFDTSDATNMQGMFQNCNSLVSLDLGDKFDTSNVTNMQSMFSGCNALTSLNLGNSFNTANVTNMNYMFDGCIALASLDLGNMFDTKNVTSMDYMFRKCGMNLLEELDLGDLFDTSNVTNMNYMFQECGKEKMVKLNISAMIFDNSKLTKKTNIFINCGKANDCTAYVNPDYYDFVTANKSSRWSSIVPVT